jgi:hypothetical protein
MHHQQPGGYPPVHHAPPQHQPQNFGQITNELIALLTANQHDQAAMDRILEFHGVTREQVHRFIQAQRGM